MSARAAAALIAVLLLALGLALGFWPHSIPGASGALHCGSAFHHPTSVPLPADASSLVRQFAAQDLRQCSTAATGALAAAWVLTAGGAVALLFLGLTSLRRSK